MCENNTKPIWTEVPERWAQKDPNIWALPWKTGNKHHPRVFGHKDNQTQTVSNLVENVNDASRKKQSINSAPSMCCEEKKEHFSPSSEHRHVSSHRVAYWLCPNQTLLHSRISHIQVKGIVNWILNMGQSYSKAWLRLSSYIQSRRIWICLCKVEVILRF